jgi:hypothetical protein
LPKGNVTFNYQAEEENMKKFLVIFVAVALIMSVTSAAQAVTVDFDGVALRPANDGSGEYGIIVEYANENGVTTNVPKGGQKVYYGTDYFNDWALSSVDYIEFTYKRANGGNNPYSNAVITDGSGNYGIISSQGGSTLWEVVDTNYTEKRIRYYYAGDSGNQAFGFRFYEPSPDAGSWPHGTNIVWSDISDWTLLGVGVQRPLYSGEAGVPRGPVDDGLAIMWGDSLNNYLGIRDIYDVTVFANGEEYVAGPVPEPTTMLLLGSGLIGLAGVRRRKK